MTGPLGTTAPRRNTHGSSNSNNSRSSSSGAAPLDRRQQSRTGRDKHGHGPPTLPVVSTDLSHLEFGGFLSAQVARSCFTGKFSCSAQTALVSAVEAAKVEASIQTPPTLDAS